MKINKEVLIDLVYGLKSEVYEVVYCEISDTGRWSIHYDCVIKDKRTGKFYDAPYSIGATESQDESPFEDDNPDEDGNLELDEVVPYEVTVTKYRRIDK